MISGKFYGFIEWFVGKADSVPAALVACLILAAVWPLLLGVKLIEVTEVITSVLLSPRDSKS